MRVWFLSAGLALMCMAQNAAAGTVLIVGDSISAGFGLDTRLGWVSLLEQRLKREGFDDKVINASISGDTSAGGQARLPALLAEHKPELVILELGGNDGLRGMLPTQLQQNLAAMIDSSGPVAPRYCCWACNCRPTMASATPRRLPRFTATWPMRKNPSGAVFLDGIGGHPDLMQADGLHPAAVAQGKLLENVWPTLKPLL
ncbi:arylesterase [Pseudomonas sp. TH31]|uniref:arylesterase n=1 Tax=Pseudomonas sp. TH31 TaxID=2796396 RepID=UPI001F5B27B7|nr:arylesterase [Pseudomonas sp. TH31]